MEVAHRTGKPATSVLSINVTSNSCEETYNEEICWICLDTASLEKPLHQPCRCPRPVHRECLARWQLQSAGSRRETHCDFCKDALPDWKQVLTPACGAAAPAVMNVNFDSKTYSFDVQPGQDGYKLFTEAIRKAFCLPDDSELNITFTCDEPSTGALLTLQGAGAYDAAVHCAAVSAARRLHSSRSAPASPATSTDGSVTPGASATSGATSTSTSSDLHHAHSHHHPSRRTDTLLPASAGHTQPQRLTRSASAPPATPSSDSSGGGVTNITSHAAAAHRSNRRLTGLGRKLRAAINDFLTSK